MAKGASSFISIGQEGQEYLGKSLFDPQALMDSQELWDYAYSWEKHSKETTGSVTLEYSINLIWQKKWCVCSRSDF